MRKMLPLIIIGLLCLSVFSILTPQAKTTDSPVVAYWRFDESSGSIGHDSSGNDYDGTVVSGSIWNDYSDEWGLCCDWSMFQHDPRHTGYSASTAPSTNNTAWNVTIGPSLSSAAVVKSVLYIGSSLGAIHALNATNGAHIWDYDTGQFYVGATPAVAGDILYYGFYALNATSGEHIWNYTIDVFMRTAPCILDGKVYISCDDQVYALNATNGARIWNSTIELNQLSSPAIADSIVYVGGGFKVYALNATDGTHIWNYTTGYPVNVSPAVVDGKVYVGSDDCNIYCLNASTGTLIWNYATEDFIGSSPAIAYGMVYAGSFDHKMYALNATDGTHVWNYTTGDIIESSPAVADGKVYIGTWNEGRLYAFGDLHDIALQNISLYKTVVGQGYSLPINTTIENQGINTETFNVTVYANTTVIQTIEVTLTSGNSTNVMFIWSTTGFAKGNYTISAYAWPIQDETDLDDNLLIDDVVLLGVPCDVTGQAPLVPDGVCNMRDIGYFCSKFMTTPSDPSWDPNCDVTGHEWRVPDGIVNMRDIGEACNQFMKPDP